MRSAWRSISKLRHAALNLVDLGGHGIDLNAQAGGGFVNQVDGLVGQEAVRDVTVGKHRGGNNGRILDAYAVVNFVALLQAAQNGDGIFHRRLAHLDGLETPLERRVLLHILLVFVERGGADATQLAARQGRLEHVGSVNRTFGSSRAHQGVQFVDEKNDLAARFFNLFEHGLQAVFKLAPVLRTRHHRTQVKRHDALRFERFRNVARHDALRDAFHNGRLAHARLADQHGIVFGAARKHLDHAANFLIAADHRVELAAPGQFRQVARVLLQRLVLGFGILIGNALRAPHRHERLQNGIVRDAQPLRMRPTGSLDFLARANSRCSVETYSSLNCSVSLNDWSKTSFKAGEI